MPETNAVACEARPVDAALVFLSNIAHEAEERPNKTFRMPFDGLLSVSDLQKDHILPMGEEWRPINELVNSPIFMCEMQNLISIYADIERYQVRQAYKGDASSFELSNLEKVLNPLFDKFSAKKFSAFGFNLTVIIPQDNPRQYLVKHMLSSAENYFGESAFSGNVSFQFKRDDEDNRLSLQIGEGKVTYGKEGIEVKGITLFFNYHLQLGRNDNPSKRKAFREKLDLYAEEALRFSKQFAAKINAE